jgi:hypothetical protein
MPRSAVVIAMALAFAGVAPVQAQEACKPTQLKNPALKLDEIYKIAEGHAKAWKADATPANLGNTSLGPLQPDGSSIAWNLKFYSDSAKSWVGINTFRGTLTCYASPGTAGRMPDLKPTFLRDGAKLYAVAKQQGESLLGQGYIVMIQTAAAPSNNHATWYINYSKDNRDGGLTVILDANTGAVEKVLK